MHRENATPIQIKHLMHTDKLSLNTDSYNTLDTIRPQCDYPEFSEASGRERSMTPVVHQARPLRDWAMATRGITLNFIG